MRYLTIFVPFSLKSGVYITLITHLNLDTKFSSDILDLHLKLINIQSLKVHLYTQVVLSIFQRFQITKSITKITKTNFIEEN